MGIVLAVGAFILFAVAVIAVGQYFEKKRQDALFYAAGRLGLVYHPDKNYALAQESQKINALRQGDNRYALDVIEGKYRGQEVQAFSYHYEVTTRNSKGGSNTSHYHLGVYTVELPLACPELTIAPEGFLSKIAQAFGYDDIDFESHEFSKIFCVRCPDKKFAYDICHPRAMEFLLQNKDLNIEMEDRCLALVFEGRLSPEYLEGNLLRLVRFKELIPEYLLQKEGAA